MGRKAKKDLPLLEKVEITGLAAEGKAMARVSDKVLFVPFAAPGDIADIRVKRSRRQYMEGEVVRFHKYSPDRTKPFCLHFGVCGGCKWQHLPYQWQLEQKQQQLTDSLRRIGKIDTDRVHAEAIIPSRQTTFYRNKLEFTFSDRRWLTRDKIDTGREIHNMQALGFHVPGQYDKVLDIEKCWLQPEPSNQIRLAVKEFAIASGLTFFDLRANRGLLRNLIIRNTEAGEVMAIVVFGEDSPGGIHKMMGFLHETFPHLHTLAYVVNEKANSSLDGLDPVIYAGRPYMEESLEGLRFRIGPKTFFQTNSSQAGRLYSVAREFAGLTGNEVVYDLYTGTGSLGCFVASGAKALVGIEYVEEAVGHARCNARVNQIGNAAFFAGDVAGVLNEDFMKAKGFPQVIIADPPRAGMHPAVLQQILKSGARRLVYVSCNPATQARDIELLSAAYRVSRARAVDMFPHTQHVESVVLLEKKC